MVDDGCFESTRVKPIFWLSDCSFISFSFILLLCIRMNLLCVYVCCFYRNDYPKKIFLGCVNSSVVQVTQPGTSLLNQVHCIYILRYMWLRPWVCYSFTSSVRKRTSFGFSGSICLSSTRITTSLTRGYHLHVSGAHHSRPMLPALRIIATGLSIWSRTPFCWHQLK